MEASETTPYVVKTSLRVGAMWIRPLVEKLVQLRSSVEAHGNLVFTLALLGRFEAGLPLTANFVSQGFIGACLRSVCVRHGELRPAVVEFAHPETLDALRATQHTVTTPMEEFHNTTGLTQTLNSAARRFRAVLVTNLFLRISGWQLRTLRLQLRCTGAKHTKVVENYLVRALQRHVNGAKLLDPAAYKSPAIQKLQLLEDMDCLAIIHLHRQTLLSPDLRDAQGTAAHDPENLGLLHNELVTRKPHLYVAYGLELQRLCETLLVEQHDRDLEREPGSRPQAPFHVIPQLCVKTRSVTFGAQQLAEFAKHFVSLDPRATELFSASDFPSKSQRQQTSTANWSQAIAKLLRAEQTELSRFAALPPERQEQQQLSHSKKLEKLRGQRQAKGAKVETTQATAEKQTLKRKRESEEPQPASKRRKTTPKPFALAKVPRSTWLRAFDNKLIAAKLFAVPLHLAKRWSGTVTTDGVVACWHLERPSSVPRRPNKLRTNTRRAPKRPRYPTRLV